MLAALAGLQRSMFTGKVVTGTQKASGQSSKINAVFAGYACMRVIRHNKSP